MEEPTGAAGAIAAKEIETTIVHEDDQILAFNDANPQAPVHILIIPRKHIPTLNDLSEEDELLLGKIHLLATRLATERGTAEGGYRTVTNCNRDAAQSVFHLHLHLLGGRKFGWPPG